MTTLRTPSSPTCVSRPAFRRDLMFCVRCGHSVGDSGSFCSMCGAAVRTQAPFASPPANLPFLDPSSGRPLAAWWKRLVALLLDEFVIGVPASIVSEIVFFNSFTSLSFPAACNGTNPDPRCTTEIFHSFFGHFLVVYAIALGVQFLVAALYFTMLIGSKRGQTVGMMALGIAVRDGVSDSSIGFGRAFVRWLVFTALSFPFGIPAIIDCLAPLWDRRRQAWHDHAAGSVVVDVRPG
jgi:uncharacterized RDD family membrane protein YckC